MSTSPPPSDNAASDAFLDRWIAEHFDKTELDFMFFFEDDMFFYNKKGEVCRNGFNR